MKKSLSLLFLPLTLSAVPASSENGFITFYDNTDALYQCEEPPIRTEVLYCARYPANSDQQQWVRVLFTDIDYSHLLEVKILSVVGA